MVKFDHRLEGNFFRAIQYALPNCIITNHPMNLLFHPSYKYSMDIPQTNFQHVNQFQLRIMVKYIQNAEKRLFDMERQSLLCGTTCTISQILSSYSIQMEVCPLNKAQTCSYRLSYLLDLSKYPVNKGTVCEKIDIFLKIS